MAVTVEHVSPGFTFCVSVPDSEPPSLPSLMENVTVTPSASELDELELSESTLTTITSDPNNKHNKFLCEKRPTKYSFQT